MNETTRRIVRIHAYGGPDALTIDHGALTMPAADECLVAVEAAGVNFYDTQLRSGAVRRKALPVEIGLEGAGRVLRTGSAV
jgi:NADPH2:quinone reductase